MSNLLSVNEVSRDGPQKIDTRSYSNMDHIAIMKKSWGLTDKILDGRKKIESHWYSLRCRPWNNIKKGDNVYFKDSGEPVRIKAEVGGVMQFADLTPGKVKKILSRYGRDDGIEKEKIHEFFERFKNKKYCVLVFIKNPAGLEPFDINKAGFGAMSAWITVDSISKIFAGRRMRKKIYAHKIR